MSDARPVWTYWTFHTPECRRHLEDPGNGCICRPPSTTEPEVSR